MSRYILGLLLATLLFSTVQAQELTSRRAQADRLFDRAEYFKAVDLYLKLTEADNVPVSVLERVADCYRLMNNYDQEEQWYARVSTMKGIQPIDLFYYAEVLLRNKKIDKAREQYQRYFANGPKDQAALKLAACDSAAAWMKQPTEHRITNEKKMNTVYSDWGPAYVDKTSIIFTSDRSTSDYKGSKGIYNRTGNEWLKLFFYNVRTSSTDEIIFDNKGDIDLTKDYHTGPMAISANSDTAYITVTTRLSKGSLPGVRTPYDQHLYIRRLELMMATKRQGRWGNFQRFPYNNVGAYSVGHAALSKDGQTLYFTSDMPGGYGKTDIWYCQRTADGKWGKPVNCGPTINTTADEAFPSVGGDGTLYFSSRGLPGMGGYDIFSAKGSGSVWSQPVNLKYPLNSTSDDFCFITNDGKTGYFSSDRQGGQGNDDIYSFVYTGKDVIERKPGGAEAIGAPPMTMVPTMAQPALASPNPTIVPSKPIETNTTVSTTTTSVPATSATVNLEGNVYDRTTGQSIDSVTVILKNAQNQTIGGALALSNKNFSFPVVPGHEYILEVRKAGFYPASQHITAKTGMANTAVITTLKMLMEPLAIGKTFIIRNIYYDLNRATIRKDAMVELDKLVTLMRDNPTMKIELSSHTDSRGSDYYNMLLSEARATSAVNYIKRRGISADRITAKGYGETRLLNGCGNGVPCDEEDHQFNRRTEIRVVAGTFKE